jgi:hypothetical protein
MSLLSCTAFFAVVAVPSVAVLGCSDGGGDGVALEREEAIGELAVPQPTENRPADRRVLAAGRRACRGRSAAAVRDRYLERTRRAVRAGSARVPGRYLKRAVEAGDRVTAQVAAFVYAAALPSRQRRNAHHGCFYELAGASRR